MIAADTRERYGYRFAGQQASVEKRALRAGDYAVLHADGEPLAAVERKSVANLVADHTEHVSCERGGVGR